MPKRDGAKLTMFGAAGFAVVDDRRNVAGLGQAVFKCSTCSTGTKQ